jgi:thioesterase domain-containing protein
LITGLNLAGQRPPLFWCFQTAREFEALARELGPDQPLFGMRSGHLIMARDHDALSRMAKHYADAIFEARPRGPCLIGGNCQGAQIAFVVAQELLSCGRQVPLLCMMEVNIQRAYPGPVALFFGRQSHERNPLRREHDPRVAWRRLYGAFTVDEISGGHGQFFQQPHVGDLAAALVRRFANAAILTQQTAS